MRENFLKEILNEGSGDQISTSKPQLPNKFDEYFKDQTSLIRLNHYPPCPSPHLALGVGPHKDSGSITMLAQDDVGDLQVKRKTNGEWIHVKPTPNAYIVNVGDCVQVHIPTISLSVLKVVNYLVLVKYENTYIQSPLHMN